MQIRGLGYVGLQGPDPKAFFDFATHVCGLMPARSVPGERAPGPPPAPNTDLSEGQAVASDGTVYLKLDERQWRIAVHPSPQPGLRYVGLEVAGREALEAARLELEREGVRVARGSEAERAARGVHDLISFSDPAGNRVELFAGVTVDRPFRSPRGVSRIVAGELGMGHVVLLVPDVAKALDFYCGRLGFRLSDQVAFGPGQGVWFLRCNARHHSIALCHVGPISFLHHMAIEFATIDDVGCALDRAQAAGIPITSSLGRHANDKMFSFYMKSPFGFDVELGTGGILVDDATWSPNEFIEGDVWGHKGLTAEAIQASGV